MLENLKKLCSLCSISGDESEVRDYIINEIKDHCEYSVDPLGSIIAFKKGKKTPQKKLLVSAHMDEVGLIVTYINDDGSLLVSPVGGVEAGAVMGRKLFVGNNKLPAAAGSVAVHNLSKKDRDKAPDIKDIYADIGALSKHEAEQMVNLGDPVYFDGDFVRLGENKIAAKAIDDRFGCALMIELIKQDIMYDTYFTFVVQEEIGLRGARAASYTVDPDMALVLEATTASDIPSAEDDKKVCCLGDGPVVSFMDRATIYHSDLYRLAFDTARELEIPCQTKTAVAGGNDAGTIHTSRGGVMTLAVSLPCRYIHSPSCVADIRDIEATAVLVKELIKRMHND